MLIAKIDVTPFIIGHDKDLFPNVSFPVFGPSNDWLTANHCMKVQTEVDYDQDTQKLVPAEPYIDGEWVYAVTVQDLTLEEIEQQNGAKKMQIKTQASRLLTETDWVELGDVSDPANPPYLTNKSEFTAYRAALRAIAVNPPVKVTKWPTKPNEVWSTSVASAA